MILLIAVILATLPYISSADDLNFDEAYQKKNAEYFVNLVENYCYEYRFKLHQLKPKLIHDGYNPDQDGIYHLYVEGIDYTISFSNSECTIDAILKPEKTLLFSLDRVESVLTSRLHLKPKGSHSTCHLSLDMRITKVLHKEYEGEDGSQYHLNYPLENEDAYYVWVSMFPVY